MNEKPLICPCANNPKIRCDKSGLKKGGEAFCRSDDGTTYDLCPVYSQWWHRKSMEFRAKAEISREERQGDYENFTG